MMRPPSTAAGTAAPHDHRDVRHRGGAAGRDLRRRSWSASRKQVRETVASNLESSQRMFAAIQLREQRRLRLQAANVAESPTLKAAVDTYAAESHAGDAVRAARSC